MCYRTFSNQIRNENRKNKKKNKAETISIERDIAARIERREGRNMQKTLAVKTSYVGENNTSDKKRKKNIYLRNITKININNMLNGKQETIVGNRIY